MALKKMMRGGFAAAAVFGLMSVAPALAQDATPSHLEAARKAVDAIDTTEQFDNILMNAATQVKADLIVNNPDLQAQISDMVDDRALALAPRRADLENEVARVYAKLFTEQELRDIGAFYESEAGKKLLKQGPLATREMMGAADVWSNGIVRDLRTAAAQGMAALAPQVGVAGVPTTEPTAAADAGGTTKPKTE